MAPAPLPWLTQLQRRVPRGVTIEPTRDGFELSWRGQLGKAGPVSLGLSLPAGLMLFAAGQLELAVAATLLFALAGGALLLRDLARGTVTVADDVLHASGSGAALGARVSLDALQHVLAYQEDRVEHDDDRSRVVTVWSLTAVTTKGERVPLFSRLPDGAHAALLEEALGLWLASRKGKPS